MFEVKSTKTENGEIVHFGNFQKGENFEKEKPIHLQIDGNKRTINARIHRLSIIKKINKNKK